MRPLHLILMATREAFVACFVYVRYLLMFKKTLLASSLCVSLALASQGVQANPVTNLLNGLFNDVTNQQLDARRGGGARRTSSYKRSTTSSTTSKSTTSSTTSSSANNTTGTTSSNSLTNNNAAKTNTQTQQDATFSRTAPNQGTNQQGYAQQGYAQQGYAQQGGMGMGSTFISSLAGAGAGVLLANMLLSPATAAEMGTEVATPDMLSDDQINECLAQLETDIADAEARLKDAAEEDKAAISEELSKLRTLQATLLKEQINRLKNQ